MTAVILSLVFILWPLLAFAGGLGFAPLAGLAALLALPVTATRLHPRYYMLALLAFMAYAAASAMWSPRPFTLVDISFAEGRFNVRSEVLRVGLLLAAIGVLMAAARSWGPKLRGVVSGVATAALLVQLIIVVVLTLFEDRALQLFSNFMPTTGEGVQNISRNSLLMAIAAPSLILGLTHGRSRLVTLVIAGTIIGIEAGVLYMRGVQAGLLALVASGLAIAIVKFLPRNGFRLIAGGIALLVWSAPLLFGFLSPDADPQLATTSTEWRMSIWNRVIDVIALHPIEGSGVGVLRTIQERIHAGVFAGALLVPNHAHNMTLQLWAETGAVGASLLALAFLLVGWRLPAPERMGVSAFRVAALAGAMTAIACVSFDLWNEWWWAAAGFLVVLMVAVTRLDGEAGQPATQVRKRQEARGITFGSEVPRPVIERAPDLVVEMASEAGVNVELAAPAQTVEPVPTVAGAATHNNFNLLRLVFALMVVVYHVAVLSGVAAWAGASALLGDFAEAGVQGFFVLSGYLVYASVERSPTVGVYAGKRVRRLYPAYAVVILACVGAALAVSPAARADLGGVAAYLAWNLAFLNFMAPTLPGLFEANTFHEVNGALWTLKIEVMFYLVLPLIGWVLFVAGERLRWVIIGLIYIAAEAWRLGLEQAGQVMDRPLLFELSRQLPGQMSFFITGVALYLLSGKIDPRVPVALIAIVLLVLSYLTPFAEPLRAAGLGLLAVWIAIGIPRLFNAAKFGDLSYGLYIVHFPIIQACVAAGLFAASPWIGVAAASGSALVAALAMWWLVERPALRADSAYRKAA